MVNTFLKKEATGLSWATIAVAMNFSNIGSYIAAEFEGFVRRHGLEGKPFVPVADHSWGGRGWDIEEGADEAHFFEEPSFGGGWFLFEDRHVSRLFSESHTSGSWLEAMKSEDGTWSLVLQVPAPEGIPYEGAYWAAFHAAIGEPLPPRPGRGGRGRSEEVPAE